MEGAVGLAGRVRELEAVTQLLSGESQHAAMLVMGELASASLGWCRCSGICPA